MNSRESFERYIKKDKGIKVPLALSETGHYQHTLTYELWQTWQAAIKYCESQKPENDKQASLLSTNETLRDKFAMAAMQGLLGGTRGGSSKGLPEFSYEIADIMLKEREK